MSHRAAGHERSSPSPPPPCSRDGFRGERGPLWLPQLLHNPARPREGGAARPGLLAALMQPVLS